MWAPVHQRVALRTHRDQRSYQPLEFDSSKAAEMKQILKRLIVNDVSKSSILFEVLKYKLACLVIVIYVVNNVFNNL